MSSSAISASSSLFLDLLTQKKSTATGTNQASDLLATSSSSANVDLSNTAQFFSKLQNLAQSDPAKFKSLTSQIAGELQTAAQGATGSQATFLNDLSKQFATASQTGDASSLQPPKTGHPHGHHAAYQAAAPSTQDATTSSVLDTIFQQVAAA